MFRYITIFRDKLSFYYYNKAMQKIFVIISVVMVLWGCQSEPDNLKLFDELVVSTNFDPETTFSAYTTYAIPTDTIGFVSEYKSERYHSGCAG